MGEFVAKRSSLNVYGSVIALVAVCVIAQFWFLFHN